MGHSRQYVFKQQKRIANMVTGRFKDYYLTGGTALAFYYKHRFSEDLDFFTQKYSGSITNKIMDFVSKNTGFSHVLDREQSKAGLIEMKVYFLEIGKGSRLKVDMVHDYTENVHKIKNGLHSLDDIYYRKILAAIGTDSKESETGRPIPTGRQSAKDLFDIYYLSKKYIPVSKFFLKYFSYEKTEPFFAWYRGFNRMYLKLELVDLVPGVDASEVFSYLDNQVLKKLPEKLI